MHGGKSAPVVLLQMQKALQPPKPGVSDAIVAFRKLMNDDPAEFVKQIGKLESDWAKNRVQGVAPVPRRMAPPEPKPEHPVEVSPATFEMPAFDKMSEEILHSLCMKLLKQVTEDARAMKLE